MYASPIIKNNRSFDTDSISRWLLSWTNIPFLFFRSTSKINAMEKNNPLRLEISYEKLNDLLANHKICAEDIRCLDAHSKQCLKKLCLKTCLHQPEKARK